MSQTHDIFLRAHTVVLATPEADPEKQSLLKPVFPRPENRKKWPEEVLAFDCESRTDIGQQLTFGFYRILRLNTDVYELVEEGAFFDDDLPSSPERHILETFAKTADTEVKSFPPRFPLYPRSEFVKAVLYKLARQGAMIVGFNLCFDLTRLACRWSEGKKNEWSLVLAQYPDGNENLNYPRILIEPIDTKKSFISFAGEWVPKDGTAQPTQIGESRFLDLRTLLWALFNRSLSLKTACELKAFVKYDLPQKIEHKPTGKVTLDVVYEERLMVLQKLLKTKVRGKGVRKRWR